MKNLFNVMGGVLLLMVLSLANAGENPRAIGAGQRAPDVTFRDLDGRQYAMQAMKDSVVVMNFWMIACTPCIDEIPKLNRLVEKYKNDNVRFVALAGEGRQQLSSFLATHPFAYKIIPEAFEIMTTHFSVKAWPMHLVIGRDGIVRRVFVGALADIDSQLDQAISALLHAKPS